MFPLLSHGSEHCDSFLHCSAVVSLTYVTPAGACHFQSNGFYHDFEEIGSKTGTIIGFPLVQDGPQGRYLAVFSLKAKMRYCAKFGVICVAGSQTTTKRGHRDVDRLENWDAMAHLLL